MKREWVLTEESGKKIDIVRNKSEFALCDLENSV